MSYQEIYERLHTVEEESRELLRVQLLIRQVINDLGAKVHTMKDEFDGTFSLYDPLLVDDQEHVKLADHFVEQVETLSLKGDVYYVVQLRFDTDDVEVVGEFSQYASALEFAHDECRRYKVPHFDKTWESLIS